MPASLTTAPTLGTRRGKAILLLLLAVGFLDFVDASIVNVALPSIRADLAFSVQNLQWVLSGYLLTYGGLILLGGRLSDLVGRRRMLVIGTLIFIVASMTAGLAQNSGSMVASRLIQGVGAAFMVPASLSILTTTFTQPADRQKALGAWGAIAGLASAVGTFLGGLLTDELDWRWVFFVNVPAAAGILVAVFRLIPADGPVRVQKLDVGGAGLVTGGMLLLVYSIVDAPSVGWSQGRTVGGLAGAGLLLLLFTVWEARQTHPLFPFSILRVKGLAAADITMVVAMAGFYSMFFFTTLYLQNVLKFDQLHAGLAYLPATFTVALGAGIGTGALAKVGTRPVIVAGALLGAGGIFWLSHIPVDGSYVTDVMLPLEVMSLGLGLLFVGVTTAAQAGVAEEQAGLAAAMINSSTWLGGALGIAAFSAIAASHTKHLLAGGTAPAQALTSGFRQALFAAAVSLGVAAFIALRSPNTHGHETGGLAAADDDLQPLTGAITG
jgi:EmrB/QacA subfamily drug resistance transporter